jgi:D-threo-aldose 1-dehydrogenase
MDSLIPAPLELRELGATGLRVGGLCVGCAPLGDMPEAFTYSVGEERALETIRTILDGPITFLDTAASYGDGESERRIGVVLRERGGLPEGFVLATKADRDLQTGDFSGDQIQRSVERSLRLLGVDRLQLVYLHDPEHTTFEAIMAAGGPADALHRLRAEGVIRHIGVAGGPIDLMTRYVATGAFEVAISHNRYTLLNVSASPFWDACGRHGVAAVNAAPYGGGMLAQGPDAYGRYAYEEADPDVLRRARAIQRICARHGVPLAAAALQFSLRDRRIASTIVGIGAPELVAETVELAEMSLPDELWNDLATVPPSMRDPTHGHFT